MYTMWGIPCAPPFATPDVQGSNVSQLVDSPDGWPNWLSLPIHGQHQLVRTPRPLYNCNSCHKPGGDWSYCCQSCNFDLHPNCALEAQLHELARPWSESLLHPLHEHMLVKARLDAFFCNGCGEKGFFWCYQCKRCAFDLHLDCASSPGKSPMESNRKSETLALTIVKTSKTSYWCGRCAEEGMVWCYSSEDCNVDLHPECALAMQRSNVKGWPASTMSRLHEEHELVKIYKAGAYTCDRCWDEGKGWSFCCESCGYDLHPKCALEMPSKSRVESGWTAEVIRERRKQMVVGAQQQRPQPEVTQTSYGNPTGAREDEHALQRQMQDLAMQSQMMKMMHDTNMNIIGNIRNGGYYKSSLYPW